MEALALTCAVLAYVWWVRRWPWQECRWCEGRGRYTRKTFTGRRVGRDCRHCAGGWVKRFGGKREHD